MKQSVKDKIQTWDNLAHLIERGSFSRNFVNKPKNSSYLKTENVIFHDPDPLSPMNFTDYLSIAYSSTSKIILLNSSVVFQQGQTIAFRIDAFDENRSQLKRGGDDVRVWLKDEKTKKSATSSIIDLKNGSYVAHFKAFINGTFDVHASISYPWEYRQLMTSMMTHHVNGFVSGLFQRGFHMEVTLCAPFRQLPNYTATCDFTRENNNMPWYCGHPYNTNLSCSDWISTRPLDSTSTLPLSDVEQRLVDKVLQYSANKSIATNLKVQVKQNENQRRDLPCNKRTRSFLQSWIEKSPRGWIQNSRWYPSTCQVTDIPLTILSQCLHNATILLVGDSAQDGIYETIRKFTNCDESNSKEWPRTSSCIKPDWNFKIQMLPHSYPLNARSESWIPKEIVSSTSDIDNIPADGKYIILLYHYLGLSSYHPDVYKERIKNLRNAVNDLLDRNPSVFVAIRGPHITIKTKAEQVIGGDNFVHSFSQILKEEFKGLWRDILFIDGMDVSIATQNEMFDLPDFLQFEMSRMFLAYACDFFSS